MPDVPPNVRSPSPEELEELAAAHHMSLSEEEIEMYAEMIPGMLEAYERLDELSPPSPDPYRTIRDPGYRPGPDEDPLNAFVTKCYVAGADSGPLAGYDVGLKDNIFVAGVELTSGSKVLEGYVPSQDATVVERVLDAGADITGKLSLEDMSYSGGGELCATGPVLNPHDSDYLAGGSSSGSAAAVVAGDVDVALGCDQGGSARMPASFCGCVGYKPTYGLVPYTGIVSAAHTLDHVGPMATNVEDCARVLDAIAGYDPLDPRQDSATEADNYLEAVDVGATDLAIGVLEQGFGFEESEEAVDATVRESLTQFESSVNGLVDVSVPMHYDGMPIWTGIVLEETVALFQNEGVGRFGRSFYDEQFAKNFGRARRTSADDFPPTLKVSLLIGEYLSREYFGVYHAKAQNLRRSLTAAYDDALVSVDLLALPTTLTTALEREDDLDQAALVERGLSMHVTNAAPFNITGHPAISVPCGTVDGLPVGLMLVGREGEDATVLRAARAFEESVDWQSISR